jgi:hypothetical protein
MIYIEAPEPYQPAPGDGPSIFLAGGITGCPDWQREARSLIADQPVVVLNPRRANYRPEHGDTLAQQIAWEHHHLQQADHTLFWFPHSDPTVTVQPITLLELGTALAETRLIGRRITIGADRRYPRRPDLELQVHHALPEHLLHPTLPATIAAALTATGLAR